MSEVISNIVIIFDIWLLYLAGNIFAQAINNKLGKDVVLLLKKIGNSGKLFKYL